MSSIAIKNPVLCWGCQYNCTAGCVAQSCPKGNWMRLIYSTSTKDAGVKRCPWCGAKVVDK